MNAVNKYIILVFLAALNKLNGSIEQALNILVLRVLQKESQIRDTLALMPILTVVSRTVYHCLYLVFLDHLPALRYLLTTHKNTVKNLTAFTLKL